MKILSKFLTIAFLTGSVLISRLSVDLVGAQNAGPEPEGLIYKARSESTVSLTAEERAWLEKHPKIRLGIDPSWSGSVYRMPQGRPRGFDADMLDLINRLAGTNIELVLGTWADLVEQAKKKDIDGLALSATSKERQEWFIFSDSYVSVYYALVTNADNAESIRGLSDLQGKTISFQKGNLWVKNLLSHIEGARTIEAVSQGKAFDMVMDKQADVACVTMTRYLALRRLLSPGNVKVVHMFGDNRLDLVYSIRKDWPQLVSIINKALAAISRPELEKFHENWAVYFDRNLNLKRDLNAAEKAWLDRNRTVRVHVFSFPPYLIVKKDREPAGLAIDFLNLIAERTGVKFEYVRTALSYNDALEKLKNRQGLDLLPWAPQGTEQGKNLLLSEEYDRSPFVIFTEVNGPFVGGLDDLSDRVVAVATTSPLRREIEKKYPKIKLLVFDTNAQAIDAVAMGEATAYVGNLTVGSELILQKGYADVKVAAPSGLVDHVLSFVIRKDWPELQSIINKGLDTITPEERSAIRSKYFSVRYEHGIKGEDILKWFLVVGGAFGIFVFLIVFWNRSLAKKVQARTFELNNSNESLQAEIIERGKAQAKLRESHDFIRGLTNSLPDMVYSVAMPERTIEWGNGSLRLLGYELKECIGRTTEFLHPTEKDYLAYGEKLAQAFAAGKDTFSTEVLLRKKSGEVFSAEVTVSLFRVDGKLVRLTGIVRDISERKQAEEALKKSEKRLKEAQRIARVGDWELDLSTDTLSWSDEIFRIFEIDRESFGASYEAFLAAVHPDDRNMVHDAYTQSVITHQPYGIDHRLLMPDGRIKYVHEQCETFYSSQGRPLRSVGTVQDITRLKQKEQELERHQQRLKALASQLTIAEENERRRIAAGLHDHVGQALAMARMGIASVRKLASEPGQTAILDEISDTLRQTLQQTRDLIYDLSPPQLNEIGLSAAIQEWLEEKVEKRQGILAEYIDSSAIDPLDKDLRSILFRSVRELVTNVIKYAGATRVKVSVNQINGWLKIIVSDNGSGFNVEAISKSPTNGGGFGLFSIKERVADLGGALEISSEPGHGTQAILSVPVGERTGIVE